MAKKKRKPRDQSASGERLTHWAPSEPITFTFEDVTFGPQLRPPPPKPLPLLYDRPPARPMPGYVAVVRVDRPDDNGYDCGIIVAMPPEFYWAPDHGLGEGVTIFYARGGMSSPADIDGYLYVPMQIIIASEPEPAG